MLVMYEKQAMLSSKEILTKRSIAFLVALIQVANISSPFK